MLTRIGHPLPQAGLRMLMVCACLFFTGCTAMIAEMIIEKSAGKEVLLFTQARYGELEQYMEIKMSRPSAVVSPTDRFFLCTAYAKVKRYNKLFSCLEQSEQHLSDYRGPSVYSLSPEGIRAFSAIQRAEALIDLGDYARAMQEAARAYELSKLIRRSPDRATESLLMLLRLQTLSILGLSQSLNGEKEAAGKTARALDAIPLDPVQKSLVSIKSVGIARIYAAQGDYKAALDAILLYEGGEAMKAAETFTNLISGFGTGVAANRLFNYFELPRYVMKYKLLLENGGITEARQGYDALLKLPMIEENGGLYWIILSDRGRIAESEGNIGQAVVFYRKAIDVIEMQRSTINTESSKIGFVGDKQEIYRLLINALYLDKQYAAAFEYVERSKARALVDLLASQKEFAIQTGDERQISELLAQGEKWEEESLVQDARPETAQVRGLAIKIRDQLREKSPELASLISVASMSVNEIQDKLPPDETLVEYYGNDKDMLVFVLSPDGLKVFQLPNEMITDRIRRFRELLASPASNDHAVLSRQLYNSLIRPVETSLGNRNLVIVPHGALHYLPFNALHDGNSYLIDRYGIRMLPSASVLRYLQTKKNSKPGGILAFGNPDLGDPGHNLIYAGREALGVAQTRLQSKVFLGREATETVLKKYGAGFNYIHFATHGLYNADLPLKSAIFLAKDAENDGILTVDKLYASKLDANLITLSACESGMGRIANGDDMIGLTRGFLYSGSSSIVASLWKVNDLATSDLMIQFYTNMKTLDKRDALRQAQLQTKQKYDHPFYWASFQLTGNAQ